MALESATFLTGLNSSNPPSGDPVANAADHIRLLKSTLQSTFPNLNAAVTSTPKNLNSDLVPVGAILPWYSTSASIPAGWGYCNGSTYAKLDGSGNIVSPNLANVVIMGAGATYAQGSAGGQASVTPTITVAGHALSVAEMPYHTHGVTDPGHQHNWNGGPGGSYWAGGSFGGGFTALTSVAVTGIQIQYAGSGSAHSHTATSSAISTLPPYKALVYMIKL